MGASIARRLIRGGHECVVYNRTPGPVTELAQEGAVAAKSIDDLIRQLRPPRTVWIMLPAGVIIEETIVSVNAALNPGDTIVDGGNTFYKDDVRRAKALKEKDIDYADIGRSGACGGSSAAFA